LGVVKGESPANRKSPFSKMSARETAPMQHKGSQVSSAAADETLGTQTRDGN
jgi:hypothetical protein